MTLLDFLTPLCFIAPAMAGIVGGKDAGGVGVMVGIGVGLVAGGLAYYALKVGRSSDRYCWVEPAQGGSRNVRLSSLSTLVYNVSP